MRLIRYVAMLVIALGFVWIRVQPVRADPPLCSLCASGNWYCDSVCRLPDDGYSTCGDEGYQCVCHPNWQISSSYQSGGYEVDYPTEGYCQYIAAYTYVVHDYNNCGGQDYTECTQGVAATADIYTCCSYYYCFGQAC